MVGLVAWSEIMSIVLTEYEDSEFLVAKLDEVLELRNQLVVV